MVFWVGLLLLIGATGAALTGLWRAAHSRAWLIASRDAEERHGPPLSVVLAMAVSLVAAGVLVFLLLARAWQGKSSLVMDVWAAGLAGEAWSAAGRWIMLSITHLGDPIALWGVGAVVGGLLLWRRHTVLLIGWLAALAGNAALNPSLKLVYERLRPEPDISGLVSRGYSFPSGHSSGAMVVYGMLAYLAWRLLPPRWHLPALWLAAALIPSIGASRVFLQAHFLSDVLAGFASGGAWLAVCIAACAAWHSTRRRAGN